MDDIYNTIPHRPPFLFIDSITEVTETGAVGVREIRGEEPQFEGHYPGNPIMPGVLLCEATFQVAAVYLVKKLGVDEESCGKRLTPVLSRIGEAKFKTMVRPGDTIRIEVTFSETISKFHFLKGVIRNQEGKLVLTNSFALALIEESA